MISNKTIPEFYLKKVNEEIDFLKATDGPLAHIVINQNKILTNQYGVDNDFTEESSFIVSKNIFHKYKDRILVLLTNNCVGYCQYCFRQKDISNHENVCSIDEIIEEIVNYSNNHTEIKEIILSGGDPITIGENEIEKILESIKEKTDIENIRLHTRSIVYNPMLFTDNLINILKKYNVRLVFHITHPYEICETVKGKIKKITTSGIRCYNQFPMLRNVNDHFLVITKLLDILDILNVRNLSIFMPDPLSFLNEYRISLKRIKEISDQVNLETPAWINSTRFVLDSSIGKLRIENLIVYDEQKNQAKFKKGNKTIIYPDFPLDKDIPGNINTLLWKG